VTDEPREHSVGKDSRDIIGELEADGWRFAGASESHHHSKIR